MILNKNDVLARFSEIAVQLGVPAEKGGTAGQQCFNSMARIAEKHAKETDRDLRKCRMEVVRRPAPDVALLDWLNSLPVATRDAAIANNVRPYVPLYENEMPEQDVDVAEGQSTQNAKLAREAGYTVHAANDSTQDWAYCIDGDYSTVYPSEGAAWVAAAEDMKLTRQEQLETLGFTDEKDYENHQRVVREMREDAEKQLAGYFELPATPVKDGHFSGLVVDVAGGVVTQKINREGHTVQHDGSKLSMTVEVGNVVDIIYRAGQGVVSGIGKSAGVER